MYVRHAHVLGATDDVWPDYVHDVDGCGYDGKRTHARECSSGKGGPIGRCLSYSNIVLCVCKCKCNIVFMQCVFEGEGA